MNITINAIILMITMVDGTGKIGQAIAFPDTLEECNYIARIMINDEKESLAAEAKQKPEDVQPRTKLKAVSCLKAKVPVNTGLQA